MILILASPVRVAGEEPRRSFIEWGRQHAKELRTLDTGQGFTDLEPLGSTIGNSRVVALGEPAHGVHEFLALRNRFFEFLVSEMGFTAIAVETGFAEAGPVDAYVGGESGDPAALVHGVFAWDTRAFEENRQLIEWIRRRNSTHVGRKIHLYGLDLTGGRLGQLRESRRSVDEALVFLDRVDAVSERQLRLRLDPFLDMFNEGGYGILSPADRDAVSAAIEDLASLFERRRVDFVKDSTEARYAIACRHAVVARQLVASFRSGIAAGAVKPPDYRDASMARDAAMADNLRWVLEREGPEGRVFIYAHNGHVKKGPTEKEASAGFFPGKPPTSMGEYLQSMLGGEMFVVGSTYGKGAATMTTPPIDAASIESGLAEVGPPVFTIGLRPAAGVPGVLEWLNRPMKMRENDQYTELNPLAAFDALVFVENVNPVHVLP